MNGNRALTEEQERDALRLWTTTALSKSQIAKRFCISRATLLRVIRRQAEINQKSRMTTGA